MHRAKQALLWIAIPVYVREYCNCISFGVFEGIAYTCAKPQQGLHNAKLVSLCAEAAGYLPLCSPILHWILIRQGSGVNA